MSDRRTTRTRRTAQARRTARARETTGARRTAPGAPTATADKTPAPVPAPTPSVPGAGGPRRFLRAALARVPLPLRGLRPRLLTSFVLVAMASSLGTGALAFREARTGVLQQSQDTVINRFRTSVDAVAPYIPFPPDQSDLQSAVDQVLYANRSSGWKIMATYDGHRAYAPSAGFVELSPELLRSVRDKRAAVFQRMNVDGRPRLVVGMPVTYTSGEGGESGEGTEPRLSGLVMFLEVPQTAEEGYVEAMVSGIERATLVALCLAVVLALLAASGVLRPVRALRRATRRMAAGHLDVRLDVTGSDELADLSQSFNETAAELERTIGELRRLEAQGRRFVADVSHELRTPLAAMSAVTDVLDLKGEDETETGEALRLISEGTNRLSGLVNDLMEISRFDAGAAELNRDEIDLAESVRRTIASRWREGQVETRLPGPGVLRARVDPRRLDVVTANLVGNALRHGAPPVRLTMEVREDETGTAWVVIEVTDNGPGISEEAMPHIFERFYKASTSRARSESSGLGLAITAENVRLHGGRIRAANLPRGGAVFTVELPLHRDGTDAEAGGGTR
ncbi:sensor histidine kinase [Streptomyces sp. NRRL S-37]|uniref:sensor histidine kinase n=1 Tax=Streptomyces sp. NRRL S-37 TaxID=1463903 RepID=UPI0004C779CC|nr:HAMP domain-containing sensor histidine kinase [Streptomyces sp. NRRL S-37]